MEGLNKVIENTDLILGKLNELHGEYKPKAEAFERMESEYKKIKKEGLRDCHLIQQGDETRTETVFKEGLRLIKEKQNEIEDIDGFEIALIRDQMMGGFQIRVKKEGEFIISREVFYKKIKLSGWDEKIEDKKYLTLRYGGWNLEGEALCRFISTMLGK